MNTFSLKDVKVGTHVIMRSGYGNGTDHVRKIIKVTPTQVVTDSYDEVNLRFRKDDGYEIGKGWDRWHKAQLVAFATEEQIAKYVVQRSWASWCQWKKADADKAERTRVTDLCARATENLKHILGPNVMMRWTTKEDGTPVFKIEVENMTEDEVNSLTGPAMDRAIKAING